MKTKSSRVIYIKKSKEGRGGGRDGVERGGGGVVAGSKRHK